MNESLASGGAKPKKPRGVKDVTCPSHKKQMGRRGGDTREKTAEKFLTVCEIKLGDGEINRLRSQPGIKRIPERNKEAGAGNNMGEAFGAIRAKWARAQV